MPKQDNKNVLMAYAEQAANAYGVPPELYKRLIQQESGWNPNVVSPRGAVGIAQFMPNTAKRFNINRSDPYQSLDAGAKYLRSNYDKLGSWERAIAGYNWGENRQVLKDPTADWYAAAPKETRDYVNVIQPSDFDRGQAPSSMLANKTVITPGTPAAFPQRLSIPQAVVQAPTTTPAPAIPQIPSKKPMTPEEQEAEKRAREAMAFRSNLETVGFLKNLLGSHTGEGSNLGLTQISPRQSGAKDVSTMGMNLPTLMQMIMSIRQQLPYETFM